MNTIDCNFDEGDCCVPNVITTYCTDCVCLGGNAATTKMKGDYDRLYYQHKPRTTLFVWDTIFRAKVKISFTNEKI